MSSAASTGDQTPASKPNASDADQQTAAETVPKTLGKYELRKKIGAGGMGAVYLAVDKQLKRTVALKMLPREKAQNPTLVKRFKAESQAAAQLKHDNIVTIYEAGEQEGYLFIALEYVEGTDVFKLISTRGVIPIKRSIAIIKQVALALQHSHSRNIVHRDIKPSNLLIQRDGTVKLTDMGLARSIDEETETSITRAGMTVGTVDYMSPEQARDSKLADIRSDIYSLGCTWYHMLTGSPPFGEGSMTNKLHGHASKSRPDPRDLNEAVPEGIVQTLHRMMARKPDDRYQTPDELLADLENTGALTKSSADRLLESISDSTDTDAGADPSAEPAGKRRRSAKSGGKKNRTRERGRRRSAASTAAAETSAGAANTSSAPAGTVTEKLGVSETPDEDRGWLKYVIGLGALAVLAMLVLFISQQFSSVFDGSGGVVVNRGNGEAFDDGGSDDGDGSGRASPDGTQTDGTEEAATGDRSDPNNPDSGGTQSTPPTRDPGPTPATPRTVGNIDPMTDTAEDNHSIGRDGEKEFLPPWIAKLPAPEQPPDTGNSAMLTFISVGRSADKVSKHSSINTAIEQLPDTGGVIQLVGTGPFDFGPLQLSTGRKIVISADPTARPVLLLHPNPDQPAQPVVTVSGGSLTLLNLQLVAVARRFPEDGEVTLFDSQASDLAVRNCTCTLLGERAGTTVVFRSSASANAKLVSEPSRILLDRTFIRGKRLTAAAVDGAACELVASSCLFVTGTAPIVQVTGSRPPAAKPILVRRRGKEVELPSRVLKFISCTGVAAKLAFRFVPGSSLDTLPLTEVLTLNSLFASTRSEGEHHLVELNKWPQQPNRSAGQSSFARLRWVVRSTVCLGWTAFLHHDVDPPLLLTSAPQWQNSWNELVRSSRFVSGRFWPTAQLPNLAEVTPQQFDPETSGANGVFATDGGLPGCATAGIVTPAPELLQRAAALAERPIMPADMFQSSEPSRVVQIDLNKGEDLGRVVSREEWRNGTLFVASGSGARKSSPIQVRGIAVRIEFRQTEGLPLEVTPRAVNPRTVAEQGLLADAFISIDAGGRIEVADGRFRIPNSASVPYPKWLVVAREGSFLFDGCVVEGPVASNSRNEGLIRWERKPDLAVKRARAGRYEQFGEIRNSFFKGKGTLMRVDGLGRAVVVRNSLLVSPDDLFDINVRGTGPHIHAAVEIDQSTLSAGKSLFRVSASPRRGQADLPLHLFARHTIFAPPLSGVPKTGPTLLTFNEPAALSEAQLQWWGLANGYSDQIKKFLDGPSVAAGTADKFDAAWSRTWAEAACLRPLSGSGAVALEQPVTTLNRVEPAGFALHPSSTATSWSTTGKPIGANVVDLGKAGPQRKFGTEKPPKTEKKKPGKPRF